jgi:hypothetical protein
MKEEPQVLKEASCSSLSATSDITYQIGNQDGTVHIRLTGNSGNGHFNGYWVSMPEILSLLNDQEGPFIWSILCPLFEGRSVNSACFLMAALKNEGLVRQSEKEPRRYELADPEEFMAKVQAMMTPKVKSRPPKKGASKAPPVEVISPVEPVTDPPTEPTVAKA